MCLPVCIFVCVCVNINLFRRFGLLLILRGDFVLQMILVIQNTALPFGHRLLFANPNLLSHLEMDGIKKRKLIDCHSIIVQFLAELS